MRTNTIPHHRSNLNERIIVIITKLLSSFFVSLIFALFTTSTSAAYAKLNNVKRPTTVDEWVQTKSGLTRNKATLYIRYVEDSSRYYKVDPKIILAIILKESTFKPNAVACSRRMPCVGLMQVTSGIHNEKGRFKYLPIHDPRRNIDLGVSVYQHELKLCKGNVRCAIEQYNRSPKKKRYASVVLGYASTIPSM